MTPLEHSLVKIAHYFDDHAIPYILIGGMANAVWGEPRATLDIDITISVPDQDIKATIAAITENYSVLVSDPEKFVAETRVLPLESPDRIRIDVIFGLLPFELDAIERAVKIKISNYEVSCCTPEDLILFKIFSDREKDIMDAGGVARRQMKTLDHDWLETRIREIAQLLNKPEIIRMWDSWK